MTRGRVWFVNVFFLHPVQTSVIICCFIFHRYNDSIFWTGSNMPFRSRSKCYITVSPIPQGQFCFPGPFCFSIPFIPFRWNRYLLWKTICNKCIAINVISSRNYALRNLELLTRQITLDYRPYYDKASYKKLLESCVYVPLDAQIKSKRIKNSYELVVPSIIALCNWNAINANWYWTNNKHRRPQAIPTRDGTPDASVERSMQTTISLSQTTISISRFTRPPSGRKHCASIWSWRCTSFRSSVPQYAFDF